MRPARAGLPGLLLVACVWAHAHALVAVRPARIATSRASAVSMHWNPFQRGGRDETSEEPVSQVPVEVRPSTPSAGGGQVEDMEALRREVEALRTEVSQTESALSSLATSARSIMGLPPPSAIVKSAAKSDSGESAEGLTTVVELRGKGALQNTAWLAVLNATNAAIENGLSSTEKNLLKLGWDEAIEQQGAYAASEDEELQELRDQLNSDEVRTLLPQLGTELLENVEYMVDKSEGQLANRVGSVDVVLFISAMIAVCAGDERVLNIQGNGPTTGISGPSKKWLVQLSEDLGKQLEESEDGKTKIPQEDAILQQFNSRLIELVQTSACALIVYNERMFRKLQGKLTDESDEELLGSYFGEVFITVLGNVVSFGITIWLFSSLFNSGAGLIENWLDGNGDTALGDMLNTAKSQSALLFPSVLNKP